MSKGRTKPYSIELTIADLIEEEGGPIKTIPNEELMRITEDLRVGDASQKGKKFARRSFKAAKMKFLRLISEGKIVDHVSKIRNPKKPKKNTKTPTSIKFIYQNDYDIRANILTKSKGRSGKTHILYGTNLSLPRFNTYLDNLIRLGLLERKVYKKRKFFKTTDLGRHYLYVFQQLKKFLSGKTTDKPVKLDKESRATAISAINNIRRKNVYSICAFILEKASEPKYKTPLMDDSRQNWRRINKYIEFLTGLKFLERVDADKFQTTPFGSQYLEEYLNFALFNYLG